MFVQVEETEVQEAEVVCGDFIPQWQKPQEQAVAAFCPVSFQQQQEQE